jgi:hypothetical protein
MPIVTCPECDKKLNAPATAAGKKVRCPGCQAAVPVPAGEDAAPAGALPPALKVVPEKPEPKATTLPRLKKNSKAETKSDEEPAPSPKWKKKTKSEPEKERNEEDEEETSDVEPGLRCANCKAAAVKALPPDEFSRKPGYVCMKCNTVMRRPGSKSGFFAVVGLGILITLLGVGLALAALDAETNRLQLFGGAGVLAILGLGGSCWAIMQSKLPVPLGAKAPPSRAGLLIAIILIGLLLAGGLVFGIMYVLHEGL